MSRLAVRLVCAGLSVALCGVAPAQDAAGTQRRTCHIGRIEESAAPTIDADLTDPCWETAPEIGPLVMVEPYEGRKPPQRTVVKILHDQHNLYFGIWCYDDDPASIRATQRFRDARLDPDDRIQILLDTFENRRTGYFFQIGAGGSIGDALDSGNGSRFQKRWDTIWWGRSRITPKGWQAEMALPFRSIPRKEGGTSWGFNFKRFKRSAGQSYQWANPVQGVPFFRVSEMGTMAGILDVNDGIGLDVVPYVAGGWKRDRTEPDDSTNFDPDVGGDLFYRLTPELTLAATLFTDFAETENDERQINLNRFPLFFPEKRDFFLEGSSYFDFAPRFSDVLPFFSRRIGLDADGEPVPLLFGLKLTGEAGPWSLGILDVETARRGTVTEQKNLAVTRVRYAIEEQTTIGMIATNGSQTLDVDNHVLGTDLYHYQDRFIGDTDLRLFLTATSSWTSGAGGEGQDYSIRALGEGREWEYSVSARSTDEEFNPALGFVRRRGVRRYRWSTEYNPRFEDEAVFRNLAFEAEVNFIQSQSGTTDELEFDLDWFGLRTIAGDELRVSTERQFERVDEDFSLFNDTATIAAGRYWGTRQRVFLRTSDGRPVSADFRGSYGDFFDGESTNLSFDLDYRSNPGLLLLGTGYSTAIVDLGPGRSFTTHIASARVDLHFTPDLSLFNLVQFDNESDLLGWQSRLRWIQQPGSNLFVVFSGGWQREDDNSLIPTEQSLVFKVVHTIRF